MISTLKSPTFIVLGSNTKDWSSVFRLHGESNSDLSPKSQEVTATSSEKEVDGRKQEVRK